MSPRIAIGGAGIGAPALWTTVRIMDCMMWDWGEESVPNGYRFGAAGWMRVIGQTWIRTRPAADRCTASR